MGNPVARVAAGAVLLLGACAPRPSAPPFPPVPPLIVEILPKPPVSHLPLLWQPGHWDWTGNGYVWIPGEFVPRGSHTDLWMPGYWGATPEGGWAWQPAHWL